MEENNNYYEKFVFVYYKISLKSRKITKENGGRCKLFIRTLQTFERLAGQKIFSLGFFFLFTRSFFSIFYSGTHHRFC